MLVRYYNEVALAASDVESALLDDPGSWLPRLAVRTEDHARSRLVEVGFGADRYRIEKLVEIELGEPVQLGSKTVLPIRWHATGASGLFPALEADLEV
ncbi:MAG: hypothetical protein HY240_02240, partial [Actinobacteria bacterium]|nr:hypothetical protein [Actinomycetota bacterium]